MTPKPHCLPLLGALALVACAGTAGRQDSASLACPVGEVVVCTGGRVAQGARISHREPRICECRPDDPRAN